jgi:hypothetical protein
MKRTLVLMVAIFLFITNYAQEYEGIERGDHEITFNGMVLHVTDMTMGNVFISYGHYFTNKLLIGLAPGLTITEGDVDASAQLFINFNFSSSKPRFPYLKASYYQSSFNGDAEFFDAGFVQTGVGFKAFLTPKVAWDTSITFGVPAAEADFENGMIMLLTGISIKW